MMKSIKSFFIVMVLLGFYQMPGVGSEQSSDRPLQSDTPKLDTSPIPKKAVPLKGSVQHSEQIVPNAAPKLNLGAGKASPLGGLNGHAVGGEGSSLLKGKTKRDSMDALKAEAQSGIGIIGVKFVMGLGRPPVVNRVFPGTPASENGLKVNDIIVAVDGVPTYGLTKDEVYNMIVGVPNTPVTISFLRKKDFQVKRMLRMDFNDITDPRVRRDYQNL